MLFASADRGAWLNRRRMHSAASDTLLERAAELERLAAQLADARAATGSVALVEAPAGQGKTALLRALKRDAAGTTVLSATGAPLERDFAFGIVRQLFDQVVHGEDGARWFKGAARLAEPVFDLTSAEADDPAHSTLYGLYWLAANLAGEQPLVLVVDDAHWADAPSLRFLDGLARRVEDLPLLLVIATRPGERALLDGLAAAPAATLIHPQPLSPRASRPSCGRPWTPRRSSSAPAWTPRAATRCCSPNCCARRRSPAPRRRRRRCGRPS